MTIPEEYGGVGGDHLSYCIALEELGRGDSSVRGIVSVSLGLVAQDHRHPRHPEQKQEWLPQLCSGRALGCFGLTEPGSGSDAGSLSTRAERKGDGWVLTGSKMFITNGTWAKVAIIFARTGGPGPRGITAFLVPTDRPGFGVREIKGKLGLRGQATAELTLDAVEVPDEWRLGEEGQGFAIAMSTLDKGRMSLAAGCVGIGQGCLDATVKLLAAAHPVRPADRLVPAGAAAHRRHRGRDCRRPGCWCGGWPTWSTGTSRSPPRRRSPSSTRVRWRCGRRTTRCRSSVGTGTSTISSSASTFATPGSPLSTRAPARSSA